MPAEHKPVRRWRRWATLAALALASAAGARSLGELRFFQLMHLKAGDLHFVARGARPTSGIVLLVVDQKSLDAFSDPLLFWHPHYADAIRAAAAAGAKVLGLDVTFPIPVEQWAGGYDQRLAQAVIEASARMPVVCGYVPSTLARQAEWPVPMNIAAAALGQTAYLNLRADPDDFIRTLEILEAPAGGSDQPAARSLALRLAEKYLGAEARWENGKLLLGEHLIPVTRQRAILINYPGPAGTFPRVSLFDFLAAARAGRTEQLRQWVGGKAVLLGMDGIEDRHATPYYTLSAGTHWNTSGVEIHASALHTLLTRQYLTPVTPPARFAALFAAALLTAVVAASFAGWILAGYLAGGVLLTVLGTHLLFGAGRLLAASEILLSGSLALVFTLVYRFLTAEKRSDLFQRAVAVFAGKKLAKMVAESETLALSGSRQMVTILFSDIRGFTSFCDEKDPALVVDLLNDYFRTMVGIIVRHHGNANKFIGDGIMAIFSDEDGTAAGDHARRAVACGWEMASQPGQFRTGVGIHTGIALVGNVGSMDKMDYTALGDTVNSASRLESLNKEYQTQLLMSEATQTMLEGAVETVCLGEVQVRGRSGSTRIYTVLELAGQARPPLTVPLR